MSYRRLAFLSSPDRYGRFAHQTFSLLSAWSLAHKLDCCFVPIRYAYFANKYNEYISYDRSSHARVEFQGKTLHRVMRGVTPDVFGNSKYNLLDPEQSVAFVTDLVSLDTSDSDTVIVHLPFDQHPGRFIKRLTPPMARDLFAIFEPLFKIGEQDATHLRTHASTVLVSVHIRRGDVTAQAHPNWFIEDIYYENLIEALYQIFGEMLRVRVFAQGGINWKNSRLRELLMMKGIVSERNSGKELLNNDEVMDFSCMLNSDLIIAGQSGYSLLASLLAFGKAQIIVTRNEISTVSQPIPYSNRINALNDLSSLNKAIAALTDCKAVKELL